MRTYFSTVCIIAIILLLYSNGSMGQAIKDSTTVSEAKNFNHFLTNLKDTLSSKKINSIETSKQFFDYTKILSPLANFANSPNLISQFKLPVDFKKPVIGFGNTNISAQIGNTTSAIHPTIGSLYTSNLSSAISVWGVPFSFGYNSQSGWSDNLGFVSSKFDKELYLEELKKRVNNTINPDEFFREALNHLYEKRDKAFLSLRNDLTGMLNEQGQDIAKIFKDKINLENVSRLGADQLLKNISNEADLKAIAKENLLVQFQNKLSLQPEYADSIKLLSSELESILRTKDQISSQVELLRNKWMKNGVLETIGGFEKEKQVAISKLMSDPETIIKIASEKFNLTGLKKIMLHAKSLNIGTSGINQGKLSFNDALLKGVSSEFLKKNRFFSPVIGSIPGIKNISDFAYANFNELPNILTTAIRMGKGDILKNFSHVSFSLFQQSNNQQFLPTGFSAALPKNLVTTFSKKVSFGESHTLLTEISKSTMLYNPSSGASGDGLKGVLNAGNLLGNMGLTVDYSGEFESLGISEKLVIRYTGSEYNNLGNFSLVSGTKEISNDIKKYLLKRKLIINIKAHYREFDLSAADRKWKSFSYMADVKWKMKKGEFIEIRYLPYFNRRFSKDENYISSKSHRLALRGNINRKIGKGLTYRNFMELASSKDNFYDFIQDRFNSNGFISFTSLQTLAIGKQTLFLNITGNHAKQNGGYLFGNSSFSMDAGITFNAAKNISLSSAAVYSEVTEMYGQLAIRQSISAMLGKRIILEGYLHAGKNVHQQSYLRIPAITGNLSISYNLK